MFQRLRTFLADLTCRFLGHRPVPVRDRRMPAYSYCKRCGLVTD